MTSEAIKASDGRAQAFVAEMVKTWGVQGALVKAKSLSQSWSYARHDPRWLRKAIEILTEMEKANHA